MKRWIALCLPSTLALFLVGLLLSAVTLTARADTFTVNTNADSGPGSLRAAIANAADGDVITFDGAYTITLMSTLTLTKRLTIDGGGQVVINGTGANLFDIASGSVVTLTNLTLTRGRPNIRNHGRLLISNSTLSLSGNPSHFGGAAFNEGDLIIVNSAFLNNSAEIDGGAIASIGTLVITDSVFSGNACWDAGSAIFGGQYSIAGSTFSNNKNYWQAGMGGAIFGGYGTIINSTFVSNTIENAINGSKGGAIYGAALTIINSTFLGNGAWEGGAIYGGDLTITNSTFSSNSAVNGSAIYASGAVTLANTLVANRLAGAGENCWGSFIDGGHNLDDGVSCGLGAASGSLSNTLALLGPLGNYGGGTLTLSLLPGSPAIDAGDSAVCAEAAGVNHLDQRSVTRPTACDIGAFESRGFTLTLSSGDAQRALINTAFAVPLAVSVTSVYAEPVAGGVVAFAGPLAGAGVTPLTATATIAGSAASQIFTANGVGGVYTVSVRAAGAPGLLTFNLTNFASQVFLPLLRH